MSRTIRTTFIISLFIILGNSISTATSEPVKREADKIQIGSNLEAVLKALGSPTGLIDQGDEKILYFANGEVRFQHGKVVKIAIKTEAEMLKQKELEKQKAADAVAKQAERDKFRIAQGEKLKSDKSEDPAFAALPTSKQLQFWRSFIQLYPEIDVSRELASTLTAFEKEQKMEKQEARLQDLERRIAEAEKEVKRSHQTRRYTSYRNYTHYGYPIYYHPHRHCRTTVINSGSRISVTTPTLRSTALTPIHNRLNLPTHSQFGKIHSNRHSCNIRVITP